MDRERYKLTNQERRFADVDGFVIPRKSPAKFINRPVSSEPPKPISVNHPSQPTLAALQPSQPVTQPLPAEPDYRSSEQLPLKPSAPFELDLPADTTKRRPKKSSKLKKVLLSSSLAVVLLLVGAGGFLGLRALSTVDKVFHGNIISDATAAFNDKPLKGETTGRVNILLAGDSSDDPGHSGDLLTDSILVLSIDTQNHTAFMLSIPRDLWVDIPGYGWQKINAANSGLGTNFPGYPQNGMGQLEHIVTTDLGIPIDYYALSDYGAFKDAVDAVGGVTVNIQSPDPRGLYDAYTHLKLPNGENNLDGQQALNLARARGDGSAGDASYGFPDTDFDRTEHQRQLFTAIAQKAKTLGVLSNPIKISDLMSALSNNIQTDLSLQNVLRLVQVTKGVDLSKVQSYAYCATLTTGCSPDVLTNYTDPASGEEALAPVAGLGDYGQMQQYYQQLISSNPVVKEGASVVILNASDVVGLAKQQQSILEEQGVNVATITDAANEYPGTMIVDNSNGAKPNTLKLLQKLYPGTTLTSDVGSPEASEAKGYTANFVVILGKNWDGTNVNLP